MRFVAVHRDDAGTRGSSGVEGCEPAPEEIKAETVAGMLSLGPHYSGSCSADQTVTINVTDTANKTYSRSFTAI